MVFGEGAMSDASEALESLLQFVETSPRERAHEEALWPHTLTLLHLEFAWAHFRVGNAERGSELASAALKMLRCADDEWWSIGEKPEEKRRINTLKKRHSRVESDRKKVCEVVADLYEFRQRQALAQTNSVRLKEGPWAEVEKLEARSRYRIHRTIEYSRILSPWVTLDPIHDFVNAMGATDGPRLAEIPSPRNSPLEPASLVVQLKSPAPKISLALDQKRAAKALYETAPLGLDAVLDAIEIYKTRWKYDATDSFNTNALWCISAILFVDACVFAIAEAVNPLTPTNVSLPAS
jgi:hypothetical protein